jgi:hypothetical protein
MSHVAPRTRHVACTHLSCDGDETGGLVRRSNVPRSSIFLPAEMLITFRHNSKLAIYFFKDFSAEGRNRGYVVVRSAARSTYCKISDHHCHMLPTSHECERKHHREAKRHTVCEPITVRRSGHMICDRRGQPTGELCYLGFARDFFSHGAQTCHEPLFKQTCQSSRSQNNCRSVTRA